MLALKLFAAAALAVARPAAAKAAVQAADKQEVKAVERFVKTGVADMTPAYIQRMMAIDPATIPQPWRDRLEAKRLELNTLKHLGEGERKGTIRIPGDDCEIPKDATSQLARMLTMAGFIEIYEEDVYDLEDETHCTERKMMCEFSLQVLVERDKKGRPRKRYFLHSRDPLLALLGELRSSKHGNHDTPFFGGKVHPTCSG